MARGKPPPPPASSLTLPASYSVVSYKTILPGSIFLDPAKTIFAPATREGFERLREAITDPNRPLVQTYADTDMKACACGRLTLQFCRTHATPVCMECLWAYDRQAGLVARAPHSKNCNIQPRRGKRSRRRRGVPRGRPHPWPIPRGIAEHAKRMLVQHWIDRVIEQVRRASETARWEDSDHRRADILDALLDSHRLGLNPLGFIIRQNLRVRGQDIARAILTAWPPRRGPRALRLEPDFVAIVHDVIIRTGGQNCKTACGQLAALFRVTPRTIHAYLREAGRTRKK
jgi:hypothetical protein